LSGAVVAPIDIKEWIWTGHGCNNNDREKRTIMGKKERLFLSIPFILAEVKS